MRNWKHKVHLTDLLEEDLIDLDVEGFVAARDAIVARFKASDWYRESGTASSLHGLVDELSYADDAHEFADTFDSIYDVADEVGAWIETLMSETTS